MRFGARRLAAVLFEEAQLAPKQAKATIKAILRKVVIWGLTLWLSVWKPDAKPLFRG
jgi:hypothetical protein